MVPSDVRRSDLVNKHIKRSIAIFDESFRLKLKFKFIGFNSIRLNSNQDSFIQRCVVITIYSFLESDVLLKYNPHNFGVRRDRSFISPYFDDPDDSSATGMCLMQQLFSLISLDGWLNFSTNIRLPAVYILDVAVNLLNPVILS